METRELKCGCSVSVPEELQPFTEEEQDYLEAFGFVKLKQVSINQQNAVCTQCGRTIATDII